MKIIKCCKSCALLILCVGLVVGLTGCVRKGCTSCYALNYDSKATLDDGSCDVKHVDRFGIYSVQDSLVTAFQDVFYSAYNIRISQRGCETDKLTIWRYANLITFEGEADIECTIVGDSIYIPGQSLFTDNQDSFDDLSIDPAVGYFKGDSIFLPFAYIDAFDPVYGYIWGVKN